MPPKQLDVQLATDEVVKHRCGIIMPISALGSYTASHWGDVLSIISDAIDKANFNPNLVSNSDSVSVIHKTIVQNLYECPMVVCDVSGKNPNVMFELGLRLAFDKPTIVIKDNETTYSFDTSPIEHLTYPKDLRFSQIVEFKQKLTEKIVHTFDESRKDANYSTFLKHFGQFTTPKLDSKEVSGQEFIIEELRSIKRLVDRALPRRGARFPASSIRNGYLDLCMGRTPFDNVLEATNYAKQCKGVRSAEIEQRGPDHYHIVARGDPDFDFSQIRSDLKALFYSDPPTT